MCPAPPCVRTAAQRGPSFSPQVMGTVSAVAPRARALWALLLASLGTAAGQPLGGESVCTAQPLAKYGITFTGKWSQAAFPKQYPLFRPPAQWSALLGECRPTSTCPAGGPVTRRAPCTSQF